MNYQLTIEEITYVATNSNAHASNWLRLLETAINTIAEGIFIASENGGYADTDICDDEWFYFPLEIRASENTDIMPHLVSVDGQWYNADFAVRVLAVYLNSSTHARDVAEINERIAI